MQKKIIALAVAGLVSGAAFAQSNVTIYGQVAAGYEFVHVSSGAAGVNGVNYQRVQDQTSRIGFKGTEDLGSGLKAVWQIESGFDISGNREGVATPGNSGVDGPVTNAGGSGFLGSRNTFVGIAGNFGTVLLGRHDTPYKLAGQKLNVFTGTTADYSGIVGEGSARFDLRANNAIAYITPTFSGFHAAIAHVPAEAAGLAGNFATANGKVGKPSAWSALGVYDNGPVYAALAYEKHNDFNTIGNSAANLPLYLASGNVGDGNSEKAWKVALGYTFAPDTVVGLMYENIKADRATGTTTQDRKDKHWGLFGSYGLGNVVLKAQYLVAKDATGSTIAAGQEDNGAKMWTVGADYNLSKRTAIVAYWAEMKNDAYSTRNFLYGAGGGNLTLSPTSGAATVSRDQDVRVVSVGLRHSF